MVITVNGVVTAPIGRVWPLLDDFAAWHVWLDAFESTTMLDDRNDAPVGSIRVLTRSDGTTIHEQLLCHDAEHHLVRYTFAGPHPFPVRRYVGTVRLEEITTEGTTFVSWSGDYDAEAADVAEAEQMFSRTYRAFLRYLERAVSTPATTAQ